MKRAIVIALAVLSAGAGSLHAAAAEPAKGPAFDCRKAKGGSIEEMICKDAELAALDRKLDGVYKAALKKAANEKPPILKATQRGWVKGRNDCWKDADKRACVKNEYVRRTAELQAKYRLVEFTGPFRLACNGNPADEVVVTYFKTEPATLIAERGDQSSLMFQQAVASGTNYVGQNESIREHQGKSTVVWGYQAPEMTCLPSR
ncbi:MAG: DUF1311 domain-containing protein [Betaproteobacteria bacterium]|nr:DUF1311 domain-containing protein [Betaproteobacteria bacterium]